MELSTDIYIQAGTFRKNRRPFVSQVKTELASYKTFRRLTDQWVELALDAAKLKLQAAKAA